MQRVRSDVLSILSAASSIRFFCDSALFCDTFMHVYVRTNYRAPDLAILRRNHRYLRVASWSSCPKYINGLRIRVFTKYVMRVICENFGIQQQLEIKYFKIYARQRGTCVKFPLKGAEILRDVGSNSLHSRSQHPAARNQILRNYLPCVRSCDPSV